jgi:hypothetical protein
MQLAKQKWGYDTPTFSSVVGLRGVNFTNLSNNII